MKVGDKVRLMVHKTELEVVINKIEISEAGTWYYAKDEARNLYINFSADLIEDKQDV